MGAFLYSAAPSASCFLKPGEKNCLIHSARLWATGEKPETSRWWKAMILLRQRTVSVSEVCSFTVILQLLRIYLIIHWYRGLSFITWELNRSANSLELSLLSQLCRQDTLRDTAIWNSPTLWRCLNALTCSLCVPFFSNRNKSTRTEEDKSKERHPTVV